MSRSHASISAIAACAAAFALAPAASLRAEARVERPDVILVLIDTLRADHLGTYGYARDTSPAIDALAERGIVFESYRSVAPWTNPAVATIFTGRHPQAVFPAAPHAKAIRQSLPRPLDTLAERLARAGYRTAALVDHPGISPSLAYDQGFETFERLYSKAGLRLWRDTGGDFVVREVSGVLADPDPRPLFLYLHLIYPHRPYDPPDPYRHMFGPVVPTEWAFIRPGMRFKLMNAYDGEIRYMDSVVERISEAVEKTGRAGNTWLVLTSDHGEGFWEHGYDEHGNSLYDELLHVPLLLVPPAGKERGLRVAAATSSVDLMPTVLDLAGLEAPSDVDGRSLLRFLNGPTDDAPTPWLFAESLHRTDVEAGAVVSGAWKLVDHATPELPDDLLFDTASDPGETVNAFTAPGDGGLRGIWIWAEMQLGLSPNVEEMRAELARHRARNRAEREALAPAAPVELDPETEEHLESLGYVD